VIQEVADFSALCTEKIQRSLIVSLNVEKACTPQYYKIGAASQTNKQFFRFWKKYYSYGFLTFFFFFFFGDWLEVWQVRKKSL